MYIYCIFSSRKICILPTYLTYFHIAVKLVKEIVTAGQEEMPEGTIYSIALLQNGAPTVQSAHETTKSMLRDMVLGDEQDEAGALDPDLLTDDVQPDERIQELLSRSDYDAMRLKRIAATLPKGVEPDLHGTGGASKPAFKKKPAPARKATSAASFFGASSSSAASKSGGSSAKPPTSSKPKPTNKLGFASAGTTAAPRKKAADVVGKENSENEDAVAVDEAPIAKKKAAPMAKKASSPKDKKKVQQQSSGKASSPNRGNVDDFVGDEDEDEDFLESEAQRRARKAKDAKAAEDKLAEQKKKQAPANRRKVIQDDDDEGDDMDVDKKEKEAAVYGEMDFHFNKGDDTANNAGGGKKEKKKRRKLVEKTSMDDRGFLITEKVWVEEDIPTDEEDNAEEAGPSPTKKLKSAFGGAAAAPGAAAKKKKPAIKNTKGMKQAGLGSFFGAKKK